MPESMANSLLLFFYIVPLVIWIYLGFCRYFFWRPILLSSNISTHPIKDLQVFAVIPARNEAEVIKKTLLSVLRQDSSALKKIIVINDNSDDQTVTMINQLIKEYDPLNKILLLQGKPLIAGWTGKLWAVHQGIQKISDLLLASEQQDVYVWLTDADVIHHPQTLSHLLSIVQNKKVDIVSVMVKLSAKSFWEKLLIPAFIYFFQKLYPFAAVASDKNKIAAAAGGCILIRKKILEKIGGIVSIRNQLIDDCALAKQVKNVRGKLWLGLTNTSIAARPYENLSQLWGMITRSAYRQLNHSFILLILTCAGMIVTYLLPWVFIILSLVVFNWVHLLLSFLTTVLMIKTYLPTLRLYQLPKIWSLLLPIAAFFYLLMTIHSAYLHKVGKGGNWKGRLQANG
ncbi:MAG TPA: glycosyltransferase [Alphaproteobacteria bacterium]|nr:glycosyltransferase [Alphaproteobacteria bacterium]